MDTIRLRDEQNLQSKVGFGIRQQCLQHLYKEYRKVYSNPKEAEEAALVIEIFSNIRQQKKIWYRNAVRIQYIRTPSSISPDPSVLKFFNS
jgi:hypothetical protein